jgi:hypothetical protein
MDFFSSQPRHEGRRFSIRKWRQSTLHELNGLASSMEPIAPAKSFVKGLPELGPANKSVLPW